VEQEEIALGTQPFSKQAPMTTDMHTTTGKLLKAISAMLSMQGCIVNKNHQREVSHELKLTERSQSQHLKS
jgi:hypothetical protein